MITFRVSWWRMSFLFLFFAIPLALSQEIWKDLSPAQQDQVKSGKQVLITEKVERKPWPKVRIYRTIAASPEEVTAIFINYDNAKAFIPNVIKSEVSKKVSPSITEVDYGIDVPILPDEYYTVCNYLEYSKIDGYSVRWKLLRAVQTKDSEGCLRIQPWNDQSIICYENLVTPGSSMAGLLRGKAISQMQATVQAIAAHVESEKKSNPIGVECEIKALRDALSTP